MARRFIVDDNDVYLDGDNITIYGDEVHHINVLRHKVGDKIQINEYIMKLGKVSEKEIKGVILQKAEKLGEPKVRITLYQSYLKSDKMEFVIQKAVELGVKKIAPFISKNCVVKLDEKTKTKKKERLQKISLEASKQCGRTDIVDVDDILNISDKDFKTRLEKNDIVLFAYEKSTDSLQGVIGSNIKKLQEDGIKNIAVIIGPEGGFDNTDLEHIFKCKNIQDISLGDRILRAETAGIYLLSVLNYVTNI